MSRVNLFIILAFIFQSCSTFKKTRIDLIHDSFYIHLPKHYQLQSAATDHFLIFKNTNVLHCDCPTKIVIDFIQVEIHFANLNPVMRQSKKVDKKIVIL